MHTVRFVTPSFTWTTVAGQPWTAIRKIKKEVNGELQEGKYIGAIFRLWCSVDGEGETFRPIEERRRGEKMKMWTKF